MNKIFFEVQDYSHDFLDLQVESDAVGARRLAWWSVWAVPGSRFPHAPGSEAKTETDRTAKFAALPAGIEAPCRDHNILPSHIPW